MTRLSLQHGHVGHRVLAEVVEVTHPITDAFADAGYRLYLVGGVVRDLVVGTIDAAYDIDLTTDAEPAAIKELVSPHSSTMWSPGERFGTVAALVEGRNLEITTHRAERYDAASRKPIVTFGQSITEDLSRRDFTVNAMAVELPGLDLIDPYGGADDLARRVLRTPLEPEVSFGDDPLRMLRAARFTPRFGLEPELALVAAATAMADRLAIVSVERVHAELERLLAVAEPGTGVRFLYRTGLLGQVVPALASDERALATACALASAPGSPLVRRAGLLLPLVGGSSEGVAEDALRHLRYDRATMLTTLALLRAVGAVVPAAPPAPVADATVRRVVARLGVDLVDDLRQLATNVVSRRQGDPAVLPFFERLDELAKLEDLGDFSPPVTGAKIMSRLGISPGPTVGEAVDHLRQHRLDHGPITRDEALALLDEWWQQRANTG